MRQEKLLNLGRNFAMVPPETWRLVCWWVDTWRQGAAFDAGPVVDTAVKSVARRITTRLLYTSGTSLAVDPDVWAAVDFRTGRGL